MRFLRFLFAEKKKQQFMKYYPLYMNLERRKCLVVGAGAVAARKARSLLECGARVTVIGEDPVPALQRLAERGLNLRPRRFRAGDLGRYALVFGATDDAEVNRELSRRSRRLGIPVNVSDDPEKSTFIVPAVYRRGDLSVAVSTGGKSPAAARAIKEDLASRCGREYAALIDLLGAYREKMTLSVDGHRRRTAVWRNIIKADVFGTMRRKGRRAAAAVIKAHIGRAERGGPHT